MNYEMIKVNYENMNFSFPDSMLEKFNLLTDNGTATLTEEEWDEFIDIFGIYAWTQS